MERDGDSKKSYQSPERFRAKWAPVRVKKTRQTKEIKPAPIPSERALETGQPVLGGQTNKLRVRPHAGLGFYERLIILNGFHADIEV